MSVSVAYDERSEHVGIEVETTENETIVVRIAPSDTSPYLRLRPSSQKRKPRQ